MLTQLEVFTPRVITPPLVVGDGPEANDPIQILSIDGLGPVNADISTVGYASLDGEVYNSSHVGKRNIVLTVRLNPNWNTQTISSLRKMLYPYFMPKNDVTLQFTSDDMEQVTIDGIVESVEPNMFTKDPILTISIVCPKPNFIATTATAVNGLTISAITTDPNEGTTINYQGSVSTGVVVDIPTSYAGLAGSNVSLVNDTNIREQLSMLNMDGDPFGPIGPKGQLEISTIQGGKYVRWVNRTGDLAGAVSELKSVQPGSIWVQLYPGANKIRVVATATGHLAWNMLYKAQYGGL